MLFSRRTHRRGSASGEVARPLTTDEEGAALAEPRALVGARADLLAEVADLLDGTSEDKPDEPLALVGLATVPPSQARAQGRGVVTVRHSR